MDPSNLYTQTPNDIKTIVNILYHPYRVRIVYTHRDKETETFSMVNEFVNGSIDYWQPMLTPTEKKK